MTVPANQLVLGGNGQDYDPNSTFPEDSEVMNQPGAMGVAVIYVTIGANQIKEGVPLQQTFAMFGVDAEGSLMNSAGHIATVPCLPYCMVQDND